MGARILMAIVVVVVAGCEPGAAGPDGGSVPDAGPVPDAGQLTDAGCFLNPTTHVEIINACTTSQGIARSPVLPLLLADGGLPPLP